eukprot:scaffold23016_cov59-Phaeocystis_antarctica.AAC.3
MPKPHTLERPALCLNIIINSLTSGKTAPPRQTRNGRAMASPWELAGRMGSPATVYRLGSSLQVPHVPGVGLGVFSHASFAIQPRPRLRTLLDGPGPQSPGVPQTKSSARLGHPCDETAVAVLLGTPKLSPPPCLLAREISAPTAP